MAAESSSAVDQRLPTFHPAINRLGQPTSEGDPRDEATLYIRGFMSDVSRPAEQAVWRRNHDQIVKSHSRGGEAFDYSWQHHRSAGLPDWMPAPVARCIQSLGYTPVPVFSTATIVRRLAFAFRGQGRQLVPRSSRAWAALAFGADALLNGGRVYTQWTQATANAREEAEVERLQSALIAMRTRYSCVRVVAYSLGCRLVLHACPLLPCEARPDEVHLVAAAVQASEAKPLLAGLSQGETHVYFSRDDHVLSLMYGVAEGSPALGYEGLTPVLPEVDVNGRSSAGLVEPRQLALKRNVVLQHDTTPLAEGKVSKSNLLAIHLMYSTLWGKIAYGGIIERDDEAN
eukprot:COSAG02_NODE_6093_length_3806_cov_2.162126_4_plen_344_part_00